MATIIEQAPDNTLLPAGMELVFTVSNNNVVANHSSVKFCAQVHMSGDISPTMSQPDHVIGTFKTTPNNHGVGIFNLRQVSETQLAADNMAKPATSDVPPVASRFKEIDGQPTSAPIPIHLIDKFSGQTHAMKYFRVRFFVEYVDGSTGVFVQEDYKNSDLYKLFNGYLNYSDPLTWTNNNISYEAQYLNLSNSSKSFVSNMPVIQYANENDYGVWSGITGRDQFNFIEFKFFDDTNTLLGTDSMTEHPYNGLPQSWTGTMPYRFIYFGVFPANLRGWSSVFTTHMANVSYYRIRAYNNLGSTSSKQYTIYINCPTLKGYEPIRLTWLNKWGAWDYYTFKQKSIVNKTKKETNYHQLHGNYNTPVYESAGYKGGKKTFRVNTTETILMNTDFVGEDIAIWFEEMINSPEIYELKGYKTDSTDTALNEYVTPVRIKSKKFTRKTIANDKLIQYQFEVEKSRIERTQAI